MKPQTTDEPAPIRDRVSKLVRIKPSRIRKNPKNWRRHPDGQREAFRGMMTEVGFAGACVVRHVGRGFYELIDGELRLEEAGPDLVANGIPCVVIDVTEAEADKLLASFDPLSSMAEVDTDALGSLIETIDIGHIEPLHIHLGELMGDEEEPEPELKAEQDETPAVPKNPTTKPGDLWKLGDHRLICGDCTDPKIVARLLNGATPFLMVTDPPYGVNYDPAWRNEAADKGQLSHADRRVGEVTNDDRADWAEAWALFPGDVVYCWCAPGELQMIAAESLTRSGFEIRNQIIWSKSHIPISRGHYSYQHEPCWYAVRKGSTAQWIGPNMASSVWCATLDKNVEGGHSTQKPLELMAKPMQHHKTESVYDPFLGSGTTLIAADQLGIRCLGCEIAPEYCDVIVQRWENLTGEKATRAKRTK